MATEKKQGWDLPPSWENAGPSWTQLFDNAAMQIKYTQMVASVSASWWAAGKSQQEIEAEARRRLQEGE